VSHAGRGRTGPFNLKIAALLCFVVLVVFLVCRTYVVAEPICAAYREQVSDHFDGKLYFNPGSAHISLPIGEKSERRSSGWLWLKFILRIDWPEWQETRDITPAGPPSLQVSKGSLIITPVGHGTFLIQMDGLNILTDPIWSTRCSPISWVGPKRHRSPGIRFEDLPPIDAVLVSHNHYDHLDIPTLKRLAGKGVRRSITTLGNRDIILDTGIPVVDEVDWWQSVRLSEDVTVTVVPAQHFSSRTLWDRNKTLWGGFVISGPSGSVYYSGDTGYGPHFREISDRFSPIRAALLPISPYWPQNSEGRPRNYFQKIHMGPAEAVQAHIDLGATVSIAAHFQVFQLGIDGFDAAPSELKAAMAQRNIKTETFLAPLPGTPLNLTGASGLASLPVAGKDN